MTFETERLILRPWNIDDTDRLYDLAKDPHVGPPCGWSPHENRKECQDVLEDILINDYTFAVVWKETGEVIGNIALMPYCESRFPENENQGEIGFWMGYPYWGNGYMTEACRRIVSYGLDELQLEKLWCAHNQDNIGSKRVQEKSGFVFHHQDSYYAREIDQRITMMVNCIDKEIRKG